MELAIIFFIVPLGLVIFAIVYSSMHKTTGERIKKLISKKKFTAPINNNYLKNVNLQKKEYKPINNWIFAFPIIVFITAGIIKKAYHETNEKDLQMVQAEKSVQQINQDTTEQQNPQVMYKTQTPEEEQAYMQEHHLIKFGNEYHWCGIKESKDILPVTKALDIGCQNDLCKISKYYDYVKQIPYEKGIEGKDKNAIDVMQEWKGDCDERSDLLASMMLANGYKVILLYTKGHTLTALNIPNYESNENRSYVMYQGRKYYIAETTDTNGQLGTYNREVMQNIKFIYDVNEKKVASSEEIHIQLYG